ncbi:hypothetical protein [Algivirga pacifica]|uniref:DKNYY family protein n=1 Tax=Algivirga pacifica TaxID=1162670 RepID=A0ABP9DG89_9BACT
MFRKLLLLSFLFASYNSTAQIVDSVCVKYLTEQSQYEKTNVLKDSNRILYDITATKEAEVKYIVSSVKEVLLCHPYTVINNDSSDLFTIVCDFYSNGRRVKRIYFMDNNSIFVDNLIYHECNKLYSFLLNKNNFFWKLFEEYTALPFTPYDSDDDERILSDSIMNSGFTDNYSGRNNSSNVIEGIGMVILDYPENPNDLLIFRHDFFVNKNDSVPLLTIKVESGEVRGNQFIDNGNLRVKTKYGLKGLDELAFRCFDRYENRYLVEVNSKTEPKYLWLASDTRLTYLEWGKHFAHNFVNVIDPSITPLRTKPKMDSDTIKYDINNCYYVEEVIGNWAKMRISSNLGVPKFQEYDTLKTCWALWRDKSSFLIKENDCF